MKHKKIYVTGMGMVSSLGTSTGECWKALCEGKNGVRRIKGFDPERFDTQVAAEIDPYCVEAKAKDLFGRRESKQMTINTKMGMLAVHEAVEQSGITKNAVDKDRVAVIMGVVSTNNAITDKKSQAHYIVKTMPNSISAWTTIRYGFGGANFNVSSACASSAYALILGEHLIRSGMADVVIAGGSDASVQPEYIRGFNQILAMSSNPDPEKACRPFTADRDGFVMGEGAGVLILESEEHAQRRNAEVYGEILGSAFISEAADITAPCKDGEGMEKCMRMAMKAAEINADQVDCVNAHGTSTYLNDKYETMAIKRIFGKHQKELSVTSVKSMLGHTVAACGAIEGIVSLQSLRHSKITPTIHYENSDPELDLDYTPNVSRDREIDVVLSNSFGFGGHNASIVWKKA